MSTQASDPATAPQPPPAMFLADARGLDFLNSVAVPVDTPVEWLGSGRDFVDWLRQAGLAREDVLAQLAFAAGPGELDAVAAQARALREWFRGFVRSHMGAPLSAGATAELDPLIRLLARDEVYGRIEPAAAGLAFVTDRRWRSPESLLLPVAKAMADVVTGADFAQVKACEGPACTLLFLDTTRGHKRRWCSMAVCGNRAKQAAHRERAAQAAGSR